MAGLQPPVSPVTVDMTYMDALIAAMAEEDNRIVLARAYHNGLQSTYMSARVTTFLDLHPGLKNFCLNICRPITLAVKDELSVSGINTTEVVTAGGTKTQAKWAWDLWQQANMDAIQSDLHEAVLAESEAFIIVEWDYTLLRPRFTLNYRYTPVTQDGSGDGQGCWMVYRNDDVNQAPVCAVKQWIQTDYDKNGSPTVITRRTIYYPDHIEKWFSDGTWKHYVELPPQQDPNVQADEPTPEPWPIPWMGSDGKPLGIPVIHFHNVGMMPEAWDAIPLQDAVNKTLVDILASDDLTAFQMLAALGWYPTTDGEAPKADGSNLLQVGPGQFIGTKDPNGKIQVIDGGDPTAMVNALETLIQFAAQVTGTPVTKFTTTKLIASAETLKEQDAQLKKKAKDRRVLLSTAWQQIFVIARRIANVEGAANLDETILFQTIWFNNTTVDELLQKMSLGVPQEILWTEAGYSSDQINAMKATDEYKARVAKWQATAQNPQPMAFGNSGPVGNSGPSGSSGSSGSTGPKESVPAGKPPVPQAA